MDVRTGQTAPVAGQLLRMVRRGEASTRSDLIRLSGLSRPTVTTRVTALLDEGYLVSAGSSTLRGRPPEVLSFNAGGGVLLSADIGATHTRVAIADLAASVLEERETDLDVGSGPDAVMGWVSKTFKSLLRGRGGLPLRGIGVGVPGPVDRDGRLVSPPIMPGWDGVRVPELLAGFGVPVAVDRDANIIALGEHRRSWSECDDLVVVKIGLGIGLGIVLGGELYRGSLGAAGELGHLWWGTDDQCRCGKTGCLETVASGWAIMQKLRERGHDVRTSADIVRLVHRGEYGAAELVREAARAIGDAVAGVVGVLNPAALVIAGNLSEAQDALLPVIREEVYRRCQPLATRDLVIAPSRLGMHAGTIGAATLAGELVFAPDQVSEHLGL